MSPDPGPHESERQRGAQNDYDLYLVRMRRVWRPPTDVYRLDDRIVVKVEIAGMDDKDIDIVLNNRRLIISGHRKDMAGKVMYHNMEIHYGEFRSEVQLSWPLDDAAVEAHYADGFLYVTLPRAREHQVQITAHSTEEEE